MSLTGGTRLNHYEIVCQLGKGGMGEVYLARDIRLEREVALKILPAGVAQDRDRMQRFILEAKAASALNHPNVATVYDIGEAEGINYIAMEYVEGQTLHAKICDRPLSAIEIVVLTIQIADALDAAHAKGITHRDIKPANLMLTKYGQIKVLDFGLVKFRQPKGQSVNSDAPTLSPTISGVVMGTVQYMSPEQVLGREIDHRSDLFSLGVVMYEMATCRLPFTGATVTETMDQILHAQPEQISRFNEQIPKELERIARKCLEKDRERRYQTARELVVDLKNLNRDDHTSTVGTRRPSGNRRNAIAVLPFTNVSGDPDAEYLSDGISESLINILSQVPKLNVIARTTAFSYKGKQVDLNAIGSELKARAVIMGRVALRGETLIIQVDLLDARAGTQLWGERYTRKLVDILEVQDEIAKQIAEKLRLRLTGEEKARLSKRPTDDPEAFGLYLKGRFFWNRFTREGFLKAIEYFNQAVEKDPTYTLAYAGLADAYGILGLYFLGPKDVSKAKAYALKAVELDETLADAHVSLGALMNFYDWDFLGAEREFQRALKLNARNALAHALYSNNLIALARLDAAISEGKEAVRLDPLSAVISLDLVRAYYYARQYDRVVEQVRKTFEMDANIPGAYLWLARAYADQGEFEKSISLLNGVSALTESWPPLLAELAYAYAASGQRDSAAQLLDQLEARAAREYINPYFIAFVYLGLGELDQVLVWLERAYEERSGWITTLNAEPRFDALRSIPQFADLIRRIGL